ncbi:MAG TPA: hypothetical protein VGA86_03735, partial [Desulfatiglandales bacterium]
MAEAEVIQEKVVDLGKQIRRVLVKEHSRNLNRLFLIAGFRTHQEQGQVRDVLSNLGKKQQ